MNATEALEKTLALAEAADRRETLAALRLTRRRYYRMAARLQALRRRNASRPKCLR
jgi:hypothetical protein